MNAGLLRHSPSKTGVNALMARNDEDKVIAKNSSVQCGQGMIGTVLIEFAGDPLMILVLIAR